MTALWYPRATQHPVPYATRDLFHSIGLILHVQQGNNSLASYFANPANGAMSHWWVSKTGTVEQYKDAAFQSWAQMAGNASYHSVETEGFTTEPLTAQQISALADLYEWGHTAFGWPLQLAETPGQPGLGWHGMGGAAWGGHTGCPGDLRKPQRTSVLALLTRPPQEDDMVRLIRTPDGEIDLELGATLIHLDGPGAQFYTAQGLPIVNVRQQDGDTARAKQGATP